MTCAAGRGLGAGPGAQGGGTLCSTGPASASYRDGPGVMPGNTILAAMTVLIRTEFAGDEALGAALGVGRALAHPDVRELTLGRQRGDHDQGLIVTWYGRSWHRAWQTRLRW